jgi:hypothetical protein
MDEGGRERRKLVSWSKLLARSGKRWGGGRFDPKRKLKYRSSFN